MKALLLSAGKGERLLPKTNELPKCLLPVGRSCLLKYWINVLTALDIERIFINVFHLKEKIIEFVNSLPLFPQRERIELLEEEYLYPTGKVLIDLKEKLLPDFLVINSDTFIYFHNIKKFIYSIEVRKGEYSGILAISKVENVSKQGLCVFDIQSKVIDFIEKPQEGGSGYIWAGLLYGNERFFEACISDEDEISKDIIPRLCGQLYVINVGEIIDVGKSLEDYEQAKEKLSFL